MEKYINRLLNVTKISLYILFKNDVFRYTFDVLFTLKSFVSFLMKFKKILYFLFLLKIKLVEGDTKKYHLYRTEINYKTFIQLLRRHYTVKELFKRNNLLYVNHLFEKNL